MDGRGWVEGRGGKMVGVGGMNGGERGADLFPGRW